MCACGQQWAGPLTSVGRSQGQLWTCTTVCPDGTQRGSEVTAMTAGTLLREFCGPVQINTAGEGGGGCKALPTKPPLHGELMPIKGFNQAAVATGQSLDSEGRA
ncbi:unnamed protein product [Gadus morhua 'NCC']